LRRWPFFDHSWGKFGVDLRTVLGRHLSNRDGRVGVQLVCGGHLVGRDGVKHGVRCVFGWEIHVECWCVRLLGLLGGQLLWRRCKRLRRVHRGNLLCRRGGIKLYELRAWLEFGHRVGRLFGLFGWDLPGRDGRLNLPELRPGFFLGVGRKRLFGLLGGHLPGSRGCFKLHGMWRGNGIELDRGVGFERLRALLGGLLLFDFGGHCVRGMHRRECCVGCGGIELCAVRRRPIRGVDKLVGVRCVPRRPVPDGHGRDGLCELRPGPIRDRGGSKRKYLPELRGRPVPDGHGRDGLCELPGGSVRFYARCKHQCLLELFGWPVSNGLGSVDLQ
jgi:hypothetical protein